MGIVWAHLHLCWHFFICALRAPLWVNAFPQNSHLNGFSPVCILSWSFMWCLNLNCLPHTLQGNGLGMVVLWVSICLFKWLFLIHSFPRISHLNGLSPVWVLQWSLKWLNWRNFFLQLGHWCCLLSTCGHECSFMALTVVQTAPHNRQMSLFCSDTWLAAATELNSSPKSTKQ